MRAAKRERGGSDCDFEVVASSSSSWWGSQLNPLLNPLLKLVQGFRVFQNPKTLQCHRLWFWFCVEREARGRGRDTSERTRTGNPEDTARLRRGAPPPPWPTPSLGLCAAGGDAEPVYTLEEVAMHAAPGDCWVAIHGRALDVTDWLASHPGGPYVFRCDPPE